MWIHIIAIISLLLLFLYKSIKKPNRFPPGPPRLPIVGSLSFINHGCEIHSNVEVQWVDHNKCHISFVKRIKKGEELLYQYPKQNRYCYQTSSKFKCIRCQEKEDMERQIKSIRKSQRIKESRKKRKIQTSERNKRNNSSKKTGK